MVRYKLDLTHKEIVRNLSRQLENLHTFLCTTKCKWEYKVKNKQNLKQEKEKLVQTDIRTYVYLWNTKLLQVKPTKSILFKIFISQKLFHLFRTMKVRHQEVSCRIQAFWLPDEEPSWAETCMRVLWNCKRGVCSNMV